jgi:hypothetical protein
MTLYCKIEENFSKYFFSHAHQPVAYMPESAGISSGVAA